MSRKCFEESSFLQNGAWNNQSTAKLSFARSYRGRDKIYLCNLGMPRAGSVQLDYRVGKLGPTRPCTCWNACLCCYGSSGDYHAVVKDHAVVVVWGTWARKRY